MWTCVLCVQGSQRRSELELKFVETGQGTLRAGWFTSNAVQRAHVGTLYLMAIVLLLLSVGFLGNVVLASGTSLFSMPLAGLLGAWMLVVGAWSHLVRESAQMMELDARGVTLITLSSPTLRTSKQLSEDVLRDPKSNRFRREAALRLAFTDLVDLGHTDVSLWFDDEQGTRTELRLDWLSQGELKRLFAKIQPFWERARAALDDDLESSRRAAEQVRALGL